MSPQLVLTILLLLATPPGQGMAETPRRESASPRGPSLSPELLVSQAPLSQDSFTMPEGLPWGTTIRLDGDPSNAPTNRILQQGFKQRFPGAAIQVASRGSDVAVQGVLDGDLDIAALGRRLTSQERAKGLVAIPLARHKIAIIISPANPFSGSLTNTQFAQIFRGEITDWEAVGGEPGPIRLIDRPQTSDTRRAFASYPVFQSVPFQAGESSIQVSDRTEDVINALGSDGIGYAIVDQVSARDDLKIVPLHDVLPDDPRYSFSQPLAYAYKGPVPNPAAQAFLGYANTASQSGDLVASRTAAAALGSTVALTGSLDSLGNGRLNATEAEGANALGALNAEALDSETAAKLGLNAPVAQVGQTTAATGRAPWWLLLLPLAIIPLLFRWMKRGSGPLAWGAAISGPVMSGRGHAGSDSEASGLALGETALAGAGLVLTSPQASPMVPDGDAGLATPHQCNMTLNPSTAAPTAGLEANTTLVSKDAPEARPRTPAAPGMGVAGGMIAGGAGLAAGAAAMAGSSGPSPENNSPELTHANGWDQAIHGENAELTSPERQTPDRPEVQRYNQERYTAEPRATADEAPAPPLLGRQLPEHSLAADSVEQSPAHEMPVGGEDRTWVTLTPLSSRQAQVNWHISQEHQQQLKALGGKHLQMKIHDADHIDLDVQPAHSTHTYPCDEGSEVRRVELPYGDRDYVAEMGYMTEDQQWLRVARSVHSHSPTPDYDGCRIVIMPCDPHRLIRRGPDTLPQAYAYWDISEERRQMLRQQGGQMLVLRVYDADQIDLDQQDAHHTEEFVIDELARDKVVEVPHGDRDYVAEIGYRTLEGEFLSLGRSLHARIPQVKSSAS